ncbi:MAG: dual specificity protein phosphatase family protein [Tatlockia sp.]|nr:dual specificity protein phosphatase family protein [Tatlockia sp.]
MRHKSDYESFFSHPIINFSNKVYFGVSHFWNRAWVAAGWVNYDEIVPSHNGKGKILLGQLPVDAFNPELLKELSPKGLIISCNESYELAGSETIVPVTKPFLWEPTGIEHHHLPFMDFSDKVHPSLLVEALDKMMETFLRGGTVYVHCKAGRSRSPLVVSLFKTILKLNSGYHPIDNSEEALRPLLDEEIRKLTEQRPQTHIDESKILLGVKVLQQYQAKRVLDNQQEYTQSAQFFTKLTQAPEFKLLWHFAYNNPQYLADMQCIMNAIYEDPLRVLETLSPHNNYDNSDLGDACGNIKENELGKAILHRLEDFLFKHQKPVELSPSALRQAYERFNQALSRYKKSDAVIDIARKLQSDLFLSSAMVDNEDKVRWLNRTADFLNDPMKKIDSYSEEAGIAILSYNPWISQLGKGMQYFAAAVFILTLLIGIISTSTVIYPIIICAAVGSLALMGVGYLIKQSSLDTDVKDDSLELVSEVMEGHGLTHPTSLSFST